MAVRESSSATANFPRSSAVSARYAVPCLANAVRTPATIATRSPLPLAIVPHFSRLFPVLVRHRSTRSVSYARARRTLRQGPAQPPKFSREIGLPSRYPSGPDAGCLGPLAPALTRRALEPFVHGAGLTPLQAALYFGWVVTSLY